MEANVLSSLKKKPHLPVGRAPAPLIKTSAHLYEEGLDQVLCGLDTTACFYLGEWWSPPS